VSRLARQIGSVSLGLASALLAIACHQSSRADTSSHPAASSALAATSATVAPPPSVDLPSDSQNGLSEADARALDARQVEIALRAHATKMRKALRAKDELQFGRALPLPVTVHTASWCTATFTSRRAFQAILQR